MTDEQDMYSVFSKAAYEFYYHDLKFAQSEIHNYGFKDWVIDPELSELTVSHILETQPRKIGMPAVGIQKSRPDGEIKAFFFWTQATAFVVIMWFSNV